MLFSIPEGAFAQEDPSKETVIVHSFSYSYPVSKARADNVRAAVLSGISDRGRVYLVDALTNDALIKINDGRRYEDVVNDDNWRTQSEAVYKSLGAKKLIIGSVNNISFSTIRSSPEDRYPSRKADITFSLKVYSIEDGSMIAAEDYSVTGYDSNNTDEGAFNAAIRDIKDKMTVFVDAHFKFETYIVELGDTDKKGRVKTLYIAGGSEMGVSDNTRFKVFTERQVGPKVMRTEVGTIVASEISEGLTLCTVSKGEGVIKEKFNNGEKLIVVLDRLGGLKGALNQLGL